MHNIYAIETNFIKFLKLAYNILLFQIFKYWINNIIKIQYYIIFYINIKEEKKYGESMYVHL